MLQKLHRHILDRTAWYRRWHAHRYHLHVHWGAAVTAVVAAAISVISASGAGASPNPTATQKIVGGNSETGFSGEGEMTVVDDEVPETICAGKEVRGRIGTTQRKLFIAVPREPHGTNWALNLAARDGADAHWVTPSGQRYTFNRPVDPRCPPKKRKGSWLTVNPQAASVTADCQYCRSETVQLGSEMEFRRGEAESAMIARSRLPQRGRWDVEGVTFYQRFPKRAVTQGLTLPMTATLVVQ